MNKLLLISLLIFTACQSNTEIKSETFHEARYNREVHHELMDTLICSMHKKKQMCFCTIRVRKMISDRGFAGLTIDPTGKACGKYQEPKEKQ